MKCPNCGNEIPDGSNVCPKCGKYFLRIKPKAVCSNCGAEVPDGAEICPGCGKRVRQAEKGEKKAAPSPKPPAKKMIRPVIRRPQGSGNASVLRMLLISVLLGAVLAGMDVWYAARQTMRGPADLLVLFLILTVVLSAVIFGAVYFASKRR